MLRIGNILRLKDPRSKNWLPKTTGEYEDCCQNLQQLRQDLLLGSKGGDEIVYQSPGSITTSRDWIEFVLKSGGVTWDLWVLGQVYFLSFRIWVSGTRSSL